MGIAGKSGMKGAFDPVPTLRPQCAAVSECFSLFGSAIVGACNPCPLFRGTFGFRSTCVITECKNARERNKGWQCACSLLSCRGARRVPHWWPPTAAQHGRMFLQSHPHRAIFKVVARSSSPSHRNQTDCRGVWFATTSARRQHLPTGSDQRRQPASCLLWE